MSRLALTLFSRSPVSASSTPPAIKAKTDWAKSHQGIKSKSDASKKKKSKDGTVKQPKPTASLDVSTVEVIAPGTIPLENTLHSLRRSIQYQASPSSPPSPPNPIYTVSSGSDEDPCNPEAHMDPLDTDPDLQEWQASLVKPTASELYLTTDPTNFLMIPRLWFMVICSLSRDRLCDSTPVLGDVYQAVSPSDAQSYHNPCHVPQSHQSAQSWEQQQTYLYGPNSHPLLDPYPHPWH